jgi:acyl-coenzyme A synthetase/AMP-(fatty) acid ligase
MNAPLTGSSVSLQEWKWEIPKTFNIGYACADRQIELGNGEEVAMIVEDDVLGTSSISYKELALKTSQFAEVIKHLNLTKQSRVLVRLPNCLQYPIAFLGTMKAGHIAVPTSTLLTAQEILYLAKDSQASILVTDSITWKDLEPMAKELSFLKTVLIHDSKNDFSN